MRKIFGSSMLLSMVGATVLGGALAWDATQQTDIEVVQTGTIAFDMEYLTGDDVPAVAPYNGPYTTTIGPNDGQFKRVGVGSLENVGSYNLVFGGGLVSIISTSGGGGLLSQVCDVNNFEGKVSPGAELLFDPILEPNTSQGAGFVVDLAVKTTAPESCMGVDVSYIVTINMATT
ncbi:MAG: hypothetical protein AB7T37_02885 [Dehalococcoidia bacterium]